jgi:hypothetical protein
VCRPIRRFAPGSVLPTTNATGPPQFRRDLNSADAVKKPMPHISAMEPAETAQVDAGEFDS